MKTNFLYIFLLVCSITFGQSKITSEEILIKNGEIELPGTLTYTKAKSPLVIWVHGSGGVDRNRNQTQYLKQFGDENHNKNIAFFTYD